MVRATRVVPDALRGEPAEEDGAGVVELREEGLRILHVDDEVLGRVRVAELARGGDVGDDDGVGVAQRLGGDVGPRQRGGLFGDGGADVVEVDVGCDDEDNLGVRAVLSLGE